MDTLKRNICCILLLVLFSGCSKDDDFDSKKTCWTCTQRKVWDVSSNGFQTIITFKYEYCNKSERDIQKIIDRLTYSGYEGGGNMNSTMTCKEQ